MSEVERIDDALRVDALDLPPQPRIVAIHWRPYENWAGKESLKVEVVSGDKTTDRDIEKAPIQEIKWAILKSLKEHQVTLFPYFYFVRESEREAAAKDR